jgi:hypothetical protein
VKALKALQWQIARREGIHKMQEPKAAGIHMFLIAHVAQGLARFSQEALRHEDDARIENGSADFHRQVDTCSWRAKA